MMVGHSGQQMGPQWDAINQGVKKGISISFYRVMCMPIIHGGVWTMTGIFLFYFIINVQITLYRIQNMDGVTMLDVHNHRK